ncbi:MAG TPA: hypothetical protein VFA33_28555 [Bryobacteraceae bacterium]|nr:hypothetical protein [Bryobacteraceae bacterium]
MSYRKRLWLLVALLAAVCGGSIWGISYYRRARLSGAPNWLSRLPTRDAVVLYADFAALRQYGILRLLDKAGAAEPEYQAFVSRTNFDYTKDLDAVMASFAPTGKYFVVRGRFDWKRLESYVASQAGRCLYTFCELDGSTPERKISFFPLQRNLMGLAVGPESDAARALQSSNSGPAGLQPPPEPVWVYLPGSLLKNAQPLPEGTRLFAAALANAESVLLTLGPQGDGFAAGLDVACQSEQDAAALAAQLERTTTLLKETIAREKQTPNPRDLSGVLTGGLFRKEKVRVVGSWPVPRVFLEALLGGNS